MPDLLGSPDARGRLRAEEGVLIASLCLYLVVLFRTAWVSDDAYITFRTISNFASGHGLTWNVGERVQAYTHPLWMFVISAGVYFTHEFYFTSLAFSILLSLAAAAVLARFVATTPMAAVLGLAGLFGSRAYVDYSTSGLENPLTYLLLAVYLAIYFRPADRRWRLIALSTVAALLALNRLDSLLLVLPSLLYAAWRERWKPALRAFALGFLPLLGWEAFSMVYYGFPLPNTAYAKLATGLPPSELWQQGFYYLLNSLNVDPLTPTLILAGLAAAYIMMRGASVAIALGVLVYLLYVVRIGGDFMSGRFLAAPLVLCAGLLSRSQLSDRWAVAALVVVVAAGFAAPHPTLLSGADYGSQSEAWIDAWGISDERAVYYPSTGLLQARRHVDMPNHAWVHEGLAIRGQAGAAVLPVGAGFFGFFAGPDLHLVDLVGLADPLLARLPATPSPFWRIGHFERRIPEGYLETLRSGENRIVEPHLAEYYDKLSLIVSGPLFDRERWAAIWQINLGAADSLLRAYADSLPRTVSIHEVERPESVREASSEGIVFSPDGLRILFGRTEHARRLRLRLDRMTAYLAVFTLGSEEVTRKLIPVGDPGEAEVANYEVGVSASAADRGYDALALFPANAQAELRLEYVEILED